MAIITHIYALSGINQSELGCAPSSTMDLGRYASNLDRSPANALLVRRTTLARLTAVVPDTRLDIEDVELQLWSDGSGQGQMHVIYRIAEDPAETVAHLSVFCHQRHHIHFELDDDQPAAAGLAQLAATGFALASLPRLQHDVLQFASFDTLVEGLFEDDGLGREGLGIVYRRLDWAHDDEGVRRPAQLNSAGVRGAAHGRGVVLLAGHEEASLNALKLTACEVLIALGRARKTRRRLEAALERDRARHHDGPGWGDLASLTRLTTVLRRERVVLAMDVMSYADGLFTPELVLDDFRGSFTAAVRFDDLVQSSTAMLVTLNDVVESYRVEAEVKARQAQDRGRQKWEVIVGVSSGIAIPFALLLSYFGVSSQVVAPPSRSIYSAHYVVPWVICLVVTLTITTLSIVRFQRLPVWRRKRLPATTPDAVHEAAAPALGATPVPVASRG